MRLATRKLLDRAFSGLGLMAITLMAAALLVILAPIFVRGTGAYVFEGTIEHRQLLFDEFHRGDAGELEAEAAQVREARAPVYAMLERFREEVAGMPRSDRREYRGLGNEFEELLAELIGPPPGAPEAALVRKRYGQTRWDRAQVKLDHLLYVESWDFSDPSKMGQKVLVPRVKDFAGTALAPAFPYIEENLEAMLQPRWTFYAGFLTDRPVDAHMFGGIWPELVGTVYLTIGAMLFAVPLGIVAAIYLTEYARANRWTALLRTCISTLAGVPSIVFGLFGLAFFINTLHVSESKSVLAGSLTLALLILPTVIRASEEAIRSVPHAYKEAALSLGAGRWHTVISVILPAALPGILTGIVISMGRAAGETAPIIFTAAVSVGKALKPLQALSEPTRALSWNLYNLCTEHEAVDEIRHVQFGMAMTLVMVVLILNLAAIGLRARVSKKLKG